MKPQRTQRSLRFYIFWRIFLFKTIKNSVILRTFLSPSVLSGFMFSILRKIKMKNKKILTRKEFIKNGCIGLGGIALAFYLPSCTTTNNLKKYSTSSFFDLKSLIDVLKKGHCAPSIMYTLLDYLHKQDDNIVRLTSGFPGGMGLSLECGGITAPIMFLGLQYGYENKSGEIPELISLGINHLNIFKDVHNSIMCSDIINKKNGCKNVIATSPKICFYCMKNYKKFNQIDEQTKTAYSKFLDHINNNSFHCTHSVLMNLKDKIEINPDLLKASWGFVGGTVMQGHTCGALYAGVFAISAKYGDVEKSFSRVIKLMKMRGKGENVDSEELNKFHKAMNISKEFGKWFETNFKCTQCRDLILADLSSNEDVDNYVSKNKIEYCKKLCNEVTEKLIKII